MKTTDNYGFKKPESTDFYNVEDQNSNMDAIDAELKSNETAITEHKLNKSNPHGVTKEQVGLNNVPNVSTNDQTPTYTVATTSTELESGEKLSVAFGKIAKAIKDLISHIANINNPHGVTKSQVGLGNVENKSSSTIRGEITSSNVTTALGYTPLNGALKGIANGVAELDSAGKVPTSQLPSFVDDVLEYSAKSSFPSTGETGKIYVDTSTNLIYRWSGSSYVEISESLALGETSSTAYRGDRGKLAYDHSQKTSGNPHKVTASDVGLGNVPNVATNDQTPTYSMAETITELSSGEKLSVAFGKTSKAIKDLISHIANKSNPHGVTASQVGLGNVNNTSDANKPVSTAQATAIADAKSAGTSAQTAINSHTANKSNPHGVTAEQIGASPSSHSHALNWERVWKNSSGTSTFAGQTLSLTISNYSAVVIMFRNSTSNSATTFSPMVRVSTGNYGAFGDFPQTNSHNHLVRQFTVKASEGIVFYSAYNNGTADNNLVIPMEVWAIY